MIYFDTDFLKFFKDLEKNNNRDWFNTNKKRYESSVKEPFQKFVEDLIIRMSKDEPAIQVTAKDAIFRIFRDTRFSADKTPYKIHASAAISAAGKKDYATPGLYLQMNHADVRIYSGTHDLETARLSELRGFISENLPEFNKLVNDKKFNEVFGEVRGEKNKRIPEEFRAAAEKQPLLYNKSFYYFTKWDPKTIFEKDLITKIMKAYAVAGKINAFFRRALGS